MKLKILLVTLFTFCFSFLSQVTTFAACTSYSETFDGNTIDTARYEYFGSDDNVQENVSQNDALNILRETEDGIEQVGIRTLTPYSGNFSVEVDLVAYDAPVDKSGYAATYLSMTNKLPGEEAKVYEIKMQRSTNLTNIEFLKSTHESGYVGVNGAATTLSNSTLPKFKFIKLGTSLSAYYVVNSNNYFLGTTTIPDESLYIALRSFKDEIIDQDVHVTFDNLNINCSISSLPNTAIETPDLLNKKFIIFGLMFISLGLLSKQVLSELRK